MDPKTPNVRRQGFNSKNLWTIATNLQYAIIQL